MSKFLATYKFYGDNCHYPKVCKTAMEEYTGKPMSDANWSYTWKLWYHVLTEVRL